MKKQIYIIAFVLLGFLLQFVIHGLVEMSAIFFLVDGDISAGAWRLWYLVHHILSLVLALFGIWFGYKQGAYWWNRIYVLR